MTDLSPLLAIRLALAAGRPRAAIPAGRFALALAFALGAHPAFAQAPETAAPPPRPLATQAPALRKPVTAPPPAPAPRAASVPQQSAVYPALRSAPARPGLPLDSVRPASGMLAAALPASAVAQCKDGTFIVPPDAVGACASHRGLRVTLPQRAAPPPAVSQVAVQPVAVATAAPANEPAPPAGATMRCKDGTYLAGTPVNGACDTHGGLAAVLAAARPTPAAPARVRRP